MKPDIVLFDEPTSALDPTMVGEVLSVIRQLATEGYTMLIVTHEMKFARDVSTRVFYLDEGTVYEEGSPQEVFDNPKRDKTRIFVKRLKTYTFETRSRDFDFIELNTQLEEFGRKQAFSQKQVYDIQLLFEELCLNLILPKLDEKEIYLRFAVEYSDTDGGIYLQTDYNGADYDALNCPEEDLSKVLVSHLAKDSVHTYKDGLNTIRCQLA